MQRHGNLDNLDCFCFFLRPWPQDAFWLVWVLQVIYVTEILASYWYKSSNVHSYWSVVKIGGNSFSLRHELNQTHPCPESQKANWFQRPQASPRHTWNSERNSSCGIPLWHQSQVQTITQTYTISSWENWKSHYQTQHLRSLKKCFKMWLSSAQIVAFLLLSMETYCHAAEDYYKTLGLKDTASIPEVKKAFRRPKV